MRELHAAPDYGTDLLSRRMARIQLDPARLKPGHLDILDDIRNSCPACQDPSRCATDLATSPEYGLENWDEYCPNAAKLRVLAALTMFPS